ncbi:MAG TPA: hypothetical protein VJ161_09940, partial [Geobacteraceae bacterium]|nr:hypothetical protein [Geobacteraceae bacterium]
QLTVCISSLLQALGILSFLGKVGKKLVNRASNSNIIEGQKQPLDCRIISGSFLPCQKKWILLLSENSAEKAGKFRKFQADSGKKPIKEQTCSKFLIPYSECFQVTLR